MKHCGVLSMTAATGALRKPFPGRARPILVVEHEVIALKSAFRRHKLLIVAGLLAASAAIAAYMTIEPFVKTAAVVVAAREIKQYAKIDPGDLRVAGFPVKSVPKDYLADIQDVAGSYALSRIVSGQIVLRGHIASDSGSGGLSLDLQQDMRCVFVPAGPDRAVGGLIRPGEFVDVVFTPRGSGYASSVGLTPFVLRSLRVLEVSQDASSGAFMGVVVLAGREDAEAIAHNMESCAVALLLAPIDGWVETEPEVWLP